jgi:16S rRNA (cytosine967-C5)-methyltransferase
MTQPPDSKNKPKSSGRAQLKGGKGRTGMARVPTASSAAPKAKQKSAPVKRAPATARTVAIQVLARVAATDAYLNVVLDTVLDEQSLKDPRDAGLVTELCYGTTRRRMTIDTVLRQFADRSLDTIEDRVLAALRLGVYQLFFMRVPKHAAVGDTVDALKAVGLERAAGFVNAILRKASALPELPKSDGDEIGRLSYETSHPAWLVKRWLRQFGPERASVMLHADNDAPALVVRTNTAKLTRDELLAQLQDAGVKCHATALSPLGIVFDAPGRVEELYGYAEGLWQVQDEAAQLVGVFGQIPANARVLDACAAPGGKACHLAQTNEVTAIDVHANKLPKIASEAKRLGLTSKLTLVQADASQPLPESLGEFDAILIDAPCAGLGTLRRHPELRYRREEKDIAELAHLQREILEQCQQVLKPGGLLVYAVCSTDTMEGPDQVEMFLRSHPDFTSEPPRGLAHLPTWQGHLRTLPGPEGLDGFFAARLRKMY